VTIKQDNHFEDFSTYESTGTHPTGEKAMKIAPPLPPHKETTLILLMFIHSLLAVTQIANMIYIRLQTAAITHNTKFFSVIHRNKTF
jgi:hypothetical protein